MFRGRQQFIDKYRETLPERYRYLNDTQVYDLALKSNPELSNAQFNEEPEEPGFLNSIAQTAKEQYYRLPQTAASLVNMLHQSIADKNDPNAAAISEMQINLYNVASAAANDSISKDPELIKFQQWAGNNPFTWGEFLTNPSMFGRVAAQSILSMGQIMTAGTLGAMVGGPVVGAFSAGAMGFVLEGTEAYGQAYDRAKQKGMSDQEITRIAGESGLAYGAVSAVLESLVPFSILRSMGFTKKLAKNTFGKFAANYLDDAAEGIFGTKAVTDAISKLAAERLTFMQKVSKFARVSGFDALGEATTEATQFLAEKAIVDSEVDGRTIDQAWFDEAINDPELSESIAGGLIGGGVFSMRTAERQGRGVYGRQAGNFASILTGQNFDDFSTWFLNNKDANRIDKIEFARTVLRNDANRIRSGQTTSEVTTEQSTSETPVTPTTPSTTPTTPPKETVSETKRTQPSEQKTSIAQRLANPELGEVLPTETQVGRTLSETALNYLTISGEKARKDVEQSPDIERKIYTMAAKAIEGLNPKIAESFKDKDGNFILSKVKNVVNMMAKENIAAVQREAAGDLMGSDIMSELGIVENPDAGANALQDLGITENPEQPTTKSVPFYENKDNIPGLAKRIAQGKKLTKNDLQLQKNFPTELEAELNKINQPKQPQPTKKERISNTETVTNTMKSLLRGMGYNDDYIKTLNPIQANTILKNQIPPKGDQGTTPTIENKAPSKPIERTSNEILGNAPSELRTPYTGKLPKGYSLLKVTAVDSKYYDELPGKKLDNEKHLGIKSKRNFYIVKDTRIGNKYRVFEESSGLAVGNDYSTIKEAVADASRKLKEQSALGDLDTRLDSLIPKRQPLNTTKATPTTAEQDNTPPWEERPTETKDINKHEKDVLGLKPNDTVYYEGKPYKFVDFAPVFSPEKEESYLSRLENGDEMSASEEEAMITSGMSDEQFKKYVAEEEKNRFDLIKSGKLNPYDFEVIIEKNGKSIGINPYLVDIKSKESFGNVSEIINETKDLNPNDVKTDHQSSNEGTDLGDINADEVFAAESVLNIPTEKTDRVKAAESYGMSSEGTSSVKNILNNIANKSPNKQYAKLAKYISKYLGRDVQVEFGDRSMFEWSASYEKMYIAPTGMVPFEQVFLHEAIHALTNRIIDGVETGVLKDANSIRAYNEIKKLFDYTRNYIGEKSLDKLSQRRSMSELITFYGVSSNNLKEFVAEAMSSPQFQQVLDSIEYKPKKSLLQRMIDIIKSIFGISPTNDSVLANSITQIVTLVQNSPEVIPGSITAKETMMIKHADNMAYDKNNLDFADLDEHDGRDEEYFDEQYDPDPGIFNDKFFASQFGVYVDGELYSKLVKLAKEYKDKPLSQKTNFYDLEDRIYSTIVNMTSHHPNVNRDSDKYKDNIKLWVQKVNSATRVALAKIDDTGRIITDYDPQKRYQGQITIEHDDNNNNPPIINVEQYTEKKLDTGGANPTSAKQSFIEEDFTKGARTKVWIVSTKDIFRKIRGAISKKTGKAFATFYKRADFQDFTVNDKSIDNLNRIFARQYLYEKQKMIKQNRDTKSNVLRFFLAETSGDNSKIILSGISQSIAEISRANFIATLDSEVVDENGKGNITKEHRDSMLADADRLSKENPLAYGQILGFHNRMKAIKGSRYLLREKDVANSYKRLKLDLFEGWVPRGIGPNRIMVIDPNNIEIMMPNQNGELINVDPLYNGKYRFDGWTMTSQAWFDKLYAVSGVKTKVLKTVVRSLNLENNIDYIALKHSEQVAFEGTEIYSKGAEKTLIARYSNGKWLDAKGNEFDRLTSTEERKDHDGAYSVTNEIITLPEDSVRVDFSVNHSAEDAAYPILMNDLMLDKDYLAKNPIASKYIDAIKKYYKDNAIKYMSQLYDFRNDTKSLRQFIQRDLQRGEFATELQQYIDLWENGEGLLIPHIIKQIVPVLNNRILVDGIYKMRKFDRGYATHLVIKPSGALDIKDNNLIISGDNKTMVKLVQNISGLGKDASLSQLNEWLKNNEFMVLVHRQPLQSFTKVQLRRLQEFIPNQGETVFVTQNDVSHVHEADYDIDSLFIEYIGGNVEKYEGYWTRDEVANTSNKVFLFGDNTNDRVNTKYIPSSTQAVIRGLPNAIGIDTKKDRGTNPTSYFTDADFAQFKKQVDDAIQTAKNSGKIIVLPADGIGTGKAMLREKAPRLFEYLQSELNKLSNHDLVNLMKRSQEDPSFEEYNRTVNLSAFKKGPLGKSLSSYNDRMAVLAYNARLFNGQGSVVNSKTILSILSMKNLVFETVESKGIKIRPRNPSSTVIMRYWELEPSELDAPFGDTGKTFREVIESEGDSIVNENGKLYLKTTKANEFSILLQAIIDNAKFGLVNKLSLVSQDKEDIGISGWLLTRMFVKDDNSGFTKKEITYLRAIYRAFNYSTLRSGKTQDRHRATMLDILEDSKGIVSRYYDLESLKQRTPEEISEQLMREITKDISDRNKFARGPNPNGIVNLSVNGEITPLETMMIQPGLYMAGKEVQDYNNAMFYDGPFERSVDDYNAIRYNAILDIQNSFLEDGIKAKTDESIRDQMWNGMDYAQKMGTEWFNIFKERKAKLKNVNTDVAEQITVKPEYSADVQEFLAKWYPKFKELTDLEQKHAAMYFLKGIRSYDVETKDGSLTTVISIPPLYVMHKPTMKEYGIAFKNNVNTTTSKTIRGTDMRFKDLTNMYAEIEKLKGKRCG